MQWILDKLIGTKYQRDIKKLRPLVTRINAREEAYQPLPENEIRNKTAEFKERLAAGETMDDLLVEAFALVKNACRRLVGTKFTVCNHEMTWDMIPFDVQLIGGIALHQGKIAQMATGEGKTLVATMPLYLNALTGRNVHLVTVNDYLARRDSQWMGLVYEYLGVSVGCIQNQMSSAERREQYSRDVVYGTASEFGFDYLRDNGMAHLPEQIVQREHFYSIVDEVDSILIDEARTPLIISGPAAVSSHQHMEEQFKKLNAPVARLWKLQEKFCNQLIQDAEMLLQQGNSDLGLHLWLVKSGDPKNAGLHSLLENRVVRETLEHTERDLMSKTSAFQPINFSENDFRGPESESLVALLQQLRNHDNALSEYMWNSTSPADKKQLEKFWEQTKDLTSADRIMLRELLLDILNRARYHDKLKDLASAGGINMSKATKSLAEMSNLTTLQRIRLNTWVLRDAYQQCLDVGTVDGVSYAVRLAEELYFTIDEKGRGINLTARGRENLSPDDTEAYRLPQLELIHVELDRKKKELEDISDSKIVVDEQEKKKLHDEIQVLRKELEEQLEESRVKSERIHNVNQLIRAHCLYQKDVEYVVQNNQVLIVDEFTGRILPGRRWSDGLHQAIEAKEGVKIERETQTLATITIQNYFRMYDKLAGMTGTAETEANEFNDIYKLDVLVIPTNRPVRRLDHNDVIYQTRREKYNAIIAEVAECHKNGQPVLLGTISVDTSELLSRMLNREGIPHNVLNAKNHEREADIVMNAGQPGAVTIATNMAGRGTDIKLGKNVVRIPREVVMSNVTLDQNVEGRTLRSILLEQPCGLHVMGSERHESRRIDRQLRGRCARQGDPGSSRFYVSLEDDLMRLFGSDRISSIMARMGMEEGQQLEHRWLNRSIETAQRRVEQHNYSIRKRTLEYDDVMNRQREVIYSFRGSIVKAENVRDFLYDIADDAIESRAVELIQTGAESSADDFVEWVNTTFPVGLKQEELGRDETLDPQQSAEIVFEKVKRAYELKIEVEDQDALPALERYVLLQSIDSLWQEYLWNIDQLREGVGLRAYGQQDPVVEYKREAYNMFASLMDSIKMEVVRKMFRSTTSLAAYERLVTSMPRNLVHREVSALSGGASAGAPARGPSKAEAQRRETQKVGRNHPCPCGSGKKYKKCCGA